MGADRIGLPVSMGADMSGEAWHDAVADLTVLELALVVTTETDGEDTIAHETGGNSAPVGTFGG